jgi:uncharacterized damage-inducible protein DinB
VAILRVGQAIFGPDEAAAAVAAATRRTTAFFAELSGAQLAAVVCDNVEWRWTARDVLAHLAGCALGYALVVEFARRGEALDSIDPREFALARLEDRRGRAADELLEELELVHEHLAERLRTMPSDLLHAPVRYGPYTWTLIDALVLASACHALAHVAAVRRALTSGHGGA